VSDEVSGSSLGPEGVSPEAVLEFLSRHRLGAERRRPGGRGWMVALLALVAAVAVVAGGLLVWRAVSRQAPDTAAPKAVAPERTGADRTSKRVSHHNAQKPQKTALPAAEQWSRGFQPWRQSAGHPASFYYEWLRPDVSCQYATHGCWRINVVTRHGCPHGVVVVVEETRGGADLGTAWGFSRRLAPRERDVVELNKDQANAAGRLQSMICRPGRS
jgi:hypothetical protein